MFGQCYASWDRADEKDPDVTKGEYARALLAETLNRAGALEGALRLDRDYPDSGGSTLVKAVDVFLDDVAETIVRGRRAHLFGGIPDGGPLQPVCAASEDNEKSQKMLGGLC